MRRLSAAIGRPVTFALVAARRRARPVARPAAPRPGGHRRGLPTCAPRSPAGRLGLLLGFQTFHPFTAARPTRRWRTCRSPSGSRSCASPRCAPRSSPRPRPPTPLDAGHRHRPRPDLPARRAARLRARRPSTSIAAIAAREGRDPDEVLYDLMLDHDGRELLMRRCSATATATSTPSARCSCTPTPCSACPTAARTAASSATRRSRRSCSRTGCATASRGARLPLELVVQKLTRDTADALRPRRPRRRGARQERRPQRHRPRRGCSSRCPSSCTTSPAAPAGWSSGPTATGTTRRRRGDHARRRGHRRPSRQARAGHAMSADVRRLDREPTSSCRRRSAARTGRPR